MPIRQETKNGVVVLTMDNPPVNALNIKDTLELAEILNSCGRDNDAASDAVRAVIITAEGKGFCAGVDIKEIEAMEGNEGILLSNRSCYDLFKAVYECAVPVVVAVNDFCLGTGIGIAGSADLVIAAEGANFGLPEVDNGALGAVTHLMRLVPQQRARYMVYTCQPASAEELCAYGSVLKVVKPSDLLKEAKEMAGFIAEKPVELLRAAKRSINGIDPVNVPESYRYEQGYTFELNLMGAGTEARQAFLNKTRKANPASEKK